MTAIAASKLTIFTGVARVPFLLLTPASLAPALVLAYRANGMLDPMRTALILIAALAAHVTVNALNEYSDFRRGIDLHTRRTPFSGGSGTLPTHPHAAYLALGLGVTATLITLLSGLTLLWLCGWQLLLPGLLGCALMLTYSPWLHRSPLACLLAPGLAFGPVMNIGAYFVLAGTFSSAAVVASLLPLALASNLLLLNQLPDIEADRAGGRRHIPIVLGWQRALHVYLFIAVCGYAAVGAGVFTGALPVASTLAITPLLIVTRIYRRAQRAENNEVMLLPALRDNVLVALFNPLLLAATILVN